MKIIIVIVFNTFLVTQSFGQSFTNITPEGFRSLSRGTIKAGDFNSDRQIDILNMGLLTSDISPTAKGATHIHQNQGDLTFDLLPDLDLDSAYEAASVWGDFNNDGHLDIFSSGWKNGSFSNSMHFGDGEGHFELNDQMSFSGLGYCDTVVGDLDSDGYLDIVTAGFGTAGLRKSIIYYNKGDSSFTVVDNVLEGLDLGSLDLCDYDLDGDLDILISGSTGTVVNNIDEAKTLVYSNFSGEFHLTDVLSESIKYGEAKWIDYNVDGKSDIVLSGFNGVSGVTKIYLNTTNGFEETSISLKALSDAAIDVGDINNDGYPDIVLSGTNTTYMYINNKEDNFEEVSYIDHGVIGGFDSDVELVDLDLDGDLDLLVCSHGSGYGTRFYRNDINISNTPPNAPTNLNYTLNENSLRFEWDVSQDLETPPASIRYDYWLVYESDTIAYSNAFADGTRKSNNHDLLQTNFVDFSSNKLGSYTLGVQAIDQTMNASRFTMLNFEIAEEFVVLDVIKPVDLILYPNPAQDQIRISKSFEGNTKGRFVSTSGRVFILGIDQDTIDVRHLAKGVYIVTIFSEHETSQKIRVSIN